MNELTVSDETYESIKQIISNPDSVVGIDATKTHIIILSLLIDLKDRLDRIEKQITAGS